MIHGQFDGQTRLGHYSLIRVRTPAAAVQTVGVLLVDQSDRLHFRLSDVVFSHDEGVLAIWEATAEILNEMADDLGGMSALRFLEDTGSNFLEISHPIALQVSDAKTDLLRLYDQYVLPLESSRSSTGIQKVGRFAIEAACSSLPNMSVECLDIIRQHKAGELGPEHLEEFLGRNPIVAGQIIRLANLGAHSRGVEIRSIRQALFRVGTDAAFGFVMALSFRPLYSSPHLRAIWNLSVRCRDAALTLATNVRRLQDIEELGLLALMADVGKIVLFNIPRFEQDYVKLRAAGYLPLACETMLSGTTHADISAELLQTWTFPHDMIEAVRFHHTPTETSSKASAFLYLSECSIECADVECHIEQYYWSVQRLQISTQAITGHNKYAPHLLAYSD